MAQNTHSGASDAPDTDGNEKTWLYITTPLDGQQRKFHVRDIEGIEQISGLFHYKLVLKSVDNTVDFSQIIGKSVTVFIERSNGVHRHINGVVSRFIQSGYDGKITTYYAEIRPWLWHLSLTTDSRIFQDMTVPEIVAELFSGYEFADFADRTSAVYQRREYCVQYQETVFDFISRLLEDEGIFYFFEHTDQSHTLVLADDADAHPVCPGLETVRLRHVFQEMQTPDEQIDRCVYEQQLISNQYGAKDFNFETPETDLTTTVDGKSPGPLRIYEFPGGFSDTDQGETIANRRIESLELPQKQLRGEGFCRGFIAGYRFTLLEHEREDMNGDYILRSVSIWADQAHYTNAFDAFPVSVPFRPPRTTPKPKIVGTQTAVVVGKSEEEIWTDQYGRIKIRFHWDQRGASDENEYCWVRVAQVWAGKNWGTLFIPRVGTEVIVSFLEGNPDRPIVIGTVYNATQTVPYSLPQDKNKSTIQTRSVKNGTAGNEIRFDDTKDSEELYIHAQKDQKLSVENDRICEILNDDTLTVTNNRSVSVQQGDDTLSVDQGKRSVTVTGDETHTNNANFKHDVMANFTLKVTGNITIEATGIVTIKGSMIKLN